nr:retrovirus-related Pol polyprotein from transposon TNT 1-94 [Tanacetum cinerariifolium]
MNAKMNDPEYVTCKVKIASHDYSKENFFATFTPHKQLTPEQIFWSNDLMKLKSKALKERTKRITPTGLTKGERGFEQTKECYLKEIGTTVESRCLALEAELANLRDNNNHDNQKELINHFYKLEGKDNVIRQLKKQLSQLQVTRSDTDRTLQVKTTDSLITKLTDQVTHLQAKNDLFRAENDKIKQRYKELYDSIKITRAKHIEQVSKLTTNNVNLKTSVSEDQVKPLVLAREKHAIDVEPIVPRVRNNRNAHLDYLRHLKESVETIRDIVEEAKLTNVPVPPSRILPSKGFNKLSVEDQPRINKSHLRTSNRIDSSSRLKRTVVQIVLYYLDSGCSKHMTGDRSRLLNFVKKFIEIVRFRNDHFGAIMGYGDYVIGNSAISRTVPRTSQQNGVVERQNRTLVEAARTVLIFSKALMFLWAEAVATACYTQNRSLIHTRHHKTSYELVHNKKPDLEFFRVFGALCYPTNDSKDLRKLQPTTDTGIFVGPAPNFLTPGQISSGLIPNSVPATPYAPPPIKNWRFYFNQCSMNIWNLLVLKDRFLLLNQYKLQSTQPAHLYLPPLIKMHPL